MELDEFEALGGDEQDLDAIAWTEVEAMLQEPALADVDVRPMPVMLAAGSIAMARDAADRAEALRLVGEEQLSEKPAPGAGGACCGGGCGCAR